MSNEFTEKDFFFYFVFKFIYFANSKLILYELLLDHMVRSASKNKLTTNTIQMVCFKVFGKDQTFKFWTDQDLYIHTSIYAAKYIGSYTAVC